MSEQAEELHEETAINETVEGNDPPEVDSDDENTEFEIVLAGQDEAASKPDPKSSTDHILNRVMRKKDKLQDNLANEQARSAELERQLQQLAGQKRQAIDVPPDEYD